MSSPDRSHRKGIALLLELAKRALDEAAARRWFDAMHWPHGECSCLRCRCANVYRCKHSKMPLLSRKYFSVKTGAAIQRSNLPLRIWLWAMKPRALRAFPAQSFTAILA